jgi:iron(III) transport system substrate-binding protein
MFDKKILFLLVLVVLLGFFILNFSKKEDNVVVVYVAHDQDYSEPILREFEEITGIKVNALYDTEATKTVGLVNRLIAEKSNPQTDVFWNNEVMRTILLKENGLIKPYCSPNAEDIPLEYKDKECYWTGFAARARVIIYNKDKMKENEMPKSIYEFINPGWKGKVCISNPLIGSGSTLTSALFASLGEEKAENLFLDMKENKVQVLESPSMVRDQVISGECWFGSTDTDDAYDAISAGKPVEMVFPDQQKNQIGTLVFPNSVMLIRNSPHSEQGKKLIDFLLSSKVEEELAESALQIPLKSSSKSPPNIPKDLKPFNTSWKDVYNKLNVSRDFIQNVFLS